MFIMRGPDWQPTSFYTGGFKVAGVVEPSNIYPEVECKGENTMHDLLDESDANTWNLKLEGDTKAFEHDKDVWVGHLPRPAQKAPLVRGFD